MTVSSETAKSGPYTGNGVTTVFAYGFRILDAGHIEVIRTVAGATSTVSPGDYTVSGVGDLAGGNVTFTVAPVAGQTITIVRNAPFTQQTDLENQGAYYAETIEEALDLAAMRDQQMAEELTRAVKLPVGSDPSGLAALTEDLIRLSDSADEIDTVAGIEAHVTTVAGISADVTTVAGIDADVTAVAGVAASVPAVAAVDGEVTAVAGIAANVTTVAGVAADVTTVAGVSADVTTVAGLTAEIAALPGQLSDAQDAADAAVAALDSFDDRYLGAKAVAPTVDNDGNALLVGAVYWDTVSNQMFTWSGAEWRPTFLTGNAVRALVTATGGQTVVTVPTYLVGANTIQVYLNGLKVMVGADYTETDQNTITFLSALTAGDEVEVIVLQPYAIGTTGAESITTEYGVTLARLLELKEGTVADLLADTTLNPAVVPVGSVIEAGGFRYQVAASGASDQHVTTAGGFKLYVLPGAEGFNVKAFGAIGDNVADDTAEIQAAINVAAAAKAAAYVPEGDYRITNTLTVPSNGNLIGENRNGSILRATGQTFVLVNITGSNAKVSRLFIRGGSVGVKTASNAAFFGQVTDCNIGYNRIGVELINTYIFLLKDNWICFNSWGVVTGAQSFQVVVRDNIIDNNLGGGGFLCLANGGTLIAGNTIEGNRKEASPGGPATGFGLWIVGLNQRTIVRDNWFEQNGNQDGSADVIISRPVEAWVDALVTDCVPAEYQAQLGSGAIITGQVNLEGSFFYATKRGVAIKLTSSNYASISIANSTFTGIKGKNNIPVDLYGSGSARLAISENNVTNTGDITIDAEMLNGIKRSYVYHTGTVPAFEFVTLDGKDLFTGYMTTREFAALPGATLDATSRNPPSGTSELKNGAVKAVGGTNGCRVVQGTGRPRAGSAAWFGTLSVPYYFAMLATGASAGATVQSSGGFGFRAAQDAQGRAIIHPHTPTGAEATLHTGDYYGWAIMTEANFNASVLKGCTRLVVTDLDVVEKPMISSVIPTSFSGPATYIWNVGDTVYNSAPAAGGKLGWVCTTAGSPGTWKAFGAIDA